MGYWTHSNPAINDSLATSQAHIQSNFTMIQGVLGSNTLSAGITWAQEDVPYATAVQTIQNLAKATPSAFMTNFGTTNNPSWFPLVNISNINLTYTGVFSGTFTGVSSATVTGMISSTAQMFGTWSNVSPLSATNLLATTDGILNVTMYSDIGAAIFTDANAVPVTPVARGYCTTNVHDFISSPVKKGHYWNAKKMQGAGTNLSIMWLPIGL